MDGAPDERLAPGDLDDQLPDGEAFRLGPGPPLVGRGERVPVHPHAGPASGDGVLPDQRVDLRQRAVGVVAGQVAVPQLLEELDRRLPADLLQPHLVGQFLGLGVGVAEDEGGGGKDQELVGRTSVAGQPTLHVGVELPAGLEGGVPAEDGVRRRTRRTRALLGVAGLEDHGAALG